MAAIKKRKTFDSSTCFLCNDKKNEKTVVSPSSLSYLTLCDSLNKLGRWNNSDAVKALKRIDDVCTPEHLRELDAHWHLLCYKNVTNKKNLAVQEKKFLSMEECKEADNVSFIQHNDDASTSDDAGRIPLTRSCTPMYCKEKCFFCDLQGDTGNQLRHVSYDSAGDSLRRAIELSRNDVFRVRLSETISPGDAHAIDVLYHKACWTKNVRNVLRSSDETVINESHNARLLASRYEFIDVVEEYLHDGNLSNMSELRTTYYNICSSNGINVDTDKTIPKSEFKKMLQSEIPGVVFTPAKQRNASERVSVETTGHTAIWKMEEESDESQLKLLLHAALAIRKICDKTDKWKFKGTLDLNKSEVPEQLGLFMKWCLVGKGEVTSNVMRTNEVTNRSKRLSQILMFECLTSRQATYSAGNEIRRTREFPLQVGVGLALHKETRSKKLVDMISRFGLSVTYDRVKEIEGMIAKAVVKKMEETNGIYIPPELTAGRFTHFATDNLDFQENTPDGKRTLHGTVLVAYQSAKVGDIVSCLQLEDGEEKFCIPHSPYNILYTTIRPNQKPVGRKLPCFESNERTKMVLRNAKVCDLSWLLSKDICNSTISDVSTPKFSGLTWSAHNSLVCEAGDRKTVIAVFPILNKSPTDPSVQLTVIEQFKKVKSVLEAPGKKAVISVDLGLYRPMQQLQMTLKTDAILMPGDLHVIMAQLRTIGSFIELSGIPELWFESGIYSEIVIKRILEGKPVRRSIEAHFVTIQVLFSLLCEEFFRQHDEERLELYKLAKNLNDMWEKNDISHVKESNEILVSKLIELDIDNRMRSFTNEMSLLRPTFAMAIQYMDMVFSMMTFIRSVRSANWNLRLAALDDFTKYFFALDLRNYASMTALHVAEMTALKEEDPETLHYLEAGLWAPKKGGRNFCCLGADEALEQENRKMKVTGGLVGITLQPQALTKYFLTAPYTTKLTAEVREASHSQRHGSDKHHELGGNASCRQKASAVALKKAFKDFTVPFQCEGPELLNLVTKRVASCGVAADVTRMSSAGAQRYEDFVRSRIVNQDVNFWDTLKNLKLELFRSTAKKCRVKTNEGFIQVKQDSSLFTRCLLVCRSHPAMDIKEIIGKYELSVVPRSLFHADGSMMHSDSKSKLMHHLEEVGKLHSASLLLVGTNNNVSLKTKDISCIDVAIIDGMAEVQIMSSGIAGTVRELAAAFSNAILKKYAMFSEIHVVFDTYINESLKSAERERRQKGMEPIRYKILGNDNMRPVALKKLLSHIANKDELTVVFSEALIDAGKRDKKNLTVAFRNEALSTFMNTDELKSTHEEADTKLILHAVHAARRGATRIRIFSPDTDVLVLAIRRTPMLPEDTAFVAMSIKKREIYLRPIFDALGPMRAASLPGLHALSGADVTGSFSGKAKTSFWKKFISAPDSTLIALSALGTDNDISQTTISEIEKFVCAVYRPTTCTSSIENLSALRWWLYSKKQIQGANLPPTLSSLLPAIRRAHFQCMEWFQDIISHPELPPPCTYGWSEENGVFDPVMCDMACAPEEVLNVIKCSCKKGRCAPPCKCATQQPRMCCTEMCGCGGEDEFCDNVHISENDRESDDLSTNEEDDSDEEDI